MPNVLLTDTFSMRLTPSERLLGDERAAALGISLSALVRLRVFSKDFEESFKLLMMHEYERKELAQILAALGQSRVASNINQIAKAMNMGMLHVTPDVIAQVNEAVDMVKWIRNKLILKLGVRA